MEMREREKGKQRKDKRENNFKQACGSVRNH